MSLASQVSDLATRIGTEFKAVRATIGALTGLTTTNKTSVVAAINEVRSQVTTAGAQINDTTASTTTVYSSSKTDGNISAAVAALVGTVPETLNTLDELAAALGDDPNAITSINTALGNRVRFDAAQTLTAPQAAQARSNIAAGTSSLVLGTTPGTAADGADPRLSDARTPTAHAHPASQVSDSTTVGRSVMTAIDAAAARTAIGAGTSSLALGTTGTTAKAGNYAPAAADISNSTVTGRSLITATDAAAARSTIGAGTSSLAIGTTAGTAADAAAVGDTNANFVTTFEAALV